MSTNKSTWLDRCALLVTALLCIACPIWFALAALGSKWGWWDWRFGLGVMTRDWGPTLAWTGVILALLTFSLWVRVRPRWGAVVAIFLGAAPALMLIGLRHQQTKVLSLPAIYDVQTDWSEPITFSDQVLAERAKSKTSNPIEVSPIVTDDGRRGKWAGMRFEDAQQIGYPQIKSLVVARPADEAAIITADAIDRAGLRLTRSFQISDDHYFEGIDRTPWYGLTDDFVVRIRKIDPFTSKIDMRSVSREGHIDLGENAKRIELVLSLIEKLAEPQK